MSRKFELFLLALIMVGVFALRSYHFSDWLYFEADQVRNANNAVDTIKNFSELPLLGPKAGGTGFHLGPISYYFEYLSGLIFGIKSPAVFAFPNFLFLFLSIPLAFYFLRHFFRKEISLLVTAMFAFSYIVTQYSRFSWNPNAMIFWGLLFILALYKINNENNTKKAGVWLLVLALSYGVSSQLHVLALLGYPLVAIIFWFFSLGLKTGLGSIKKEWERPSGIIKKILSVGKRWLGDCPLKKISWRYWFGAAALIFVLYIPLIVYDINSNGANAKEFLKAFGAKSGHHSFVDSFETTAQLYGENYALTLASFNDKEFSDVAVWGCLFILISLSLVVLLLSENKKFENIAKLPKDFLVLMLIWFSVFLLIHCKLAFEIDQPRFWFPVFFVPFIFSAVILSVFWHKKAGKIIAVLLCGIIIFLNLSAMFNWYGGMKYQDKKSRFHRKITTSTLIQNDFIGYGQMEKAASWIKSETEKGTGLACFNSPSTYLASYKYIFDTKYPDFKSRRINKTIEMNLANNCDIFIIDHSGDSPKEIEKKFNAKDIKITLEDKKEFGLVTVWKVVLGK